MNPRIPPWMQALWDVYERRPYVTVAAAGVAATTAAAPWTPLPMALFLTGFFSFTVGTVLQMQRVSQARDERDAADREVGRLRIRLAEAEARPVVEAATLALRAIGETGERT